MVRGSRVVVATGHSARAFYAALARKGVAMQSKPYALGFRIEHPQEVINNIQYGDKLSQGQKAF